MAKRPPKFNEYNLKLILFLQKLGIKSADPVNMARWWREKDEPNDQK